MKTKIENELNRFSSAQKKLIYENLYAIELTEGCSMGCGFCGLDSNIGIGEVIPFPTLEIIAQEISKFTDRITNWRNDIKFSMPPNHIWLYDATDPLDYEFDEKHYFHAHELFQSKGFKVPTSTAIPKEKESLAIENLSDINQLSISHMNRKRLQPYFKQLEVSVYVDLFSYFKKKYKNNNYMRKMDETPISRMMFKVELSADDTLRYLRTMDPSLPDKLRFYDMRLDGNKLRENVQDLETLFMFCGNPGEPLRKGRVVDKDESLVWNIGRAYDIEDIEFEYPNDPRMPFNCHQGVKITPQGIFNIYPIRPSDDNKTGTLVERVRPEDFKVVKIDRKTRLTNFNHISPFEYVG